MIRAAAVAAVALAACVPGQSARTLAPGRTALTVGVAHTIASVAQDDEEPQWSGAVMLRRGITRRFDVGLVAARTPGTGDSRSTFAVDPKVQLTPPTSRVTASLGLALGMLVHDDGERRALGPQLDLALARPSVFLGVDATPTLEITLAGHAWFGNSNDHGDESFTAYNLTGGLRVTDTARTWAIHAELGWLTVADEDADFLTIGLGVTAGD